MSSILQPVVSEVGAGAARGGIVRDTAMGVARPGRGGLT